MDFVDDDDADFQLLQYRQRANLHFDERHGVTEARAGAGYIAWLRHISLGSRPLQSRLLLGGSRGLGRSLAGCGSRRSTASALQGVDPIVGSGDQDREGKHVAAARHARRAAALLRRPMKAPDRAFERALGMSPATLAEYAEAATSPLIYRRRRLDSLNPCSISFSDQIPAGGGADRKKETVIVIRRGGSTPIGAINKTLK